MNEAVGYIAKVAQQDIKKLEKAVEAVHRLVIGVKRDSPGYLKKDLLTKMLDFERGLGAVELEVMFLSVFADYRKASEIRKRKNMIENLYTEELHPLLEQIFINRGLEEHIT